MAKKEDEAQKESSENAQVLIRASQVQTSNMGVWCNTVASWAPVTGMITNGYSEGIGDVHISMMNNWSDDP